MLDFANLLVQILYRENRYKMVIHLLKPPQKVFETSIPKTVHVGGEKANDKYFNFLIFSIFKILNEPTI